MSPKGKNKKMHRKDESSSSHVEDKQSEKKKHRKDESTDIYGEDKQFEKKKHRKDKSSDIYGEDKRFKKKKDRKDESSDIHVDDNLLKKQYFDDNRLQTEFVYYDPYIIQEVDVFQATSQHSHFSYENDEVEAVDHVVEAKEQDEMKE
ncbi:hypothetical protein QFZ28_002888 [Neobacillus niacini]|uniref:hypothetical protein n=1 Tax=Neobacillus niacini TaxID=86668 RepID=UPI00277D5337|nr:hypothetical protein [Neobacillus niacini]MDQ1002488.1 hypothetical protein [Neobacillus niacini]